MPSATQSPAFAGFDSRLIPHAERAALLETFASTRSGREKPSRFWKHDLEALSVEALPIQASAGTVKIESANPRVVACDLVTAATEKGTDFARAFRKALRPEHKFAYLTQAFVHLGAFVHFPHDVNADEPVIVTYTIAPGETMFPYTLVLADPGARGTVIERVVSPAGTFVCGIAEIVSGENSGIVYANASDCAEDARSVFTRVARPGRNATVQWSVAECGSSLSVSDVAITIEEPGVDAQIAALFFPSGSEHVDMVSTIDHAVGDSSSETIVKSAATGAGQGRYLGNIRIAAHAQRSMASLRDDALLLSQRSHIDSIPALEIAANDVKAYHGATVGALDEEQIFYMTSRGIEPQQAERMIALGFFEPVIERFPTETLREELRELLARKVSVTE